jgi:hypothetical protein
MNQSGWQLFRIDVAPEEPTRVTLKLGTETVCFNTPNFAVGRRDAKTAALAKFVAKSGFGEVIDLFRYLASLGPDWDGPLPVTGLDGTVDMRELEATA